MQKLKTRVDVEREKLKADARGVRAELLPLGGQQRRSTTSSPGRTASATKHRRPEDQHPGAARRLSRRKRWSESTPCPVIMTGAFSFPHHSVCDYLAGQASSLSLARTGEMPRLHVLPRGFRLSRAMTGWKPVLRTRRS